jgi:hypothetical protein
MLFKLAKSARQINNGLIDAIHDALPVVEDNHHAITVYIVLPLATALKATNSA